MKKGEGAENLVFGSLFSLIMAFFVFSVMSEFSLDAPGFTPPVPPVPPSSSDSSVETPVDGWRKCSSCPRRMSKKSADRHTECITCRGFDCDINNRCEECLEWSLLVRRLGRGLGRPSRLSGRFGPVGPPSGSVVYQRQGTAHCSAGTFPVPVSSPRSHGGCLLRQHHGGRLPSQGGWHQVSSPQQLGSGDLTLDGVPLHPPGSTVPSGLQQRPGRRPVSPSPTPT